MIDSARLLTDLKKQLKVLQADLRRSADDPEHPWGARLHQQHRAARARERTSQSWLDWREGQVDQAAVAWVLATTFLRFCEDNHLLDGARDQSGRPVATLWVAGPEGRTARAVENQTAYFSEPDHRDHNTRDWLHQAFRVLAAQPAGRALVDPDHNLVWSAPISAESAKDLVDFWRKTDSTALVHDFTDPDLGTRFLGDLYQDLSEHAKKAYALLQTPVFVEEFILDQTLTPAVQEFGLEGLRLIDPTCGSGHFLLGAFERLNTAWIERQPGMDTRTRINKVLDSVHGVDINPFAVAIARFRLTVAAMQAAGWRSLAGTETPNLRLRIGIGDSLLWATQSRQTEIDVDQVAYNLYDTEDLDQHGDILLHGSFHVVVGNPPYISIADNGLKQLYRSLYKTTYREFPLSVPFMELFFRLAVRQSTGRPSGYVGKITANSFARQEFGRKLIEQYLPGLDYKEPVDLTTIVDTAGAYLPGHGTPTVIIFGRRRPPQDTEVRCLLSLRGEPSRPKFASQGHVWAEIQAALQAKSAFLGEYIAVEKLPRTSLSTHPWPLVSPSARAILSNLTAASKKQLRDAIKINGYTGQTNADDAFISTRTSLLRRGVEEQWLARYVTGEEVRDYGLEVGSECIFPYLVFEGLVPTKKMPGLNRALWPLREYLWSRATFGKKTYKEEGKSWHSWHQISMRRLDVSQVLTFPSVQTHNHFTLAKGWRVFNRHAAYLTLGDEATEDDYLSLLGLLNSALTCFWLKQVSHSKGNGGIGGGIGDEDWEPRYEFSGTKLQQFPLPAVLPGGAGRLLDGLATELSSVSPAAVLADPSGTSGAALVIRVKEARERWHELRARMVFEQEELDWEVYRLYGLIDEDLTYSGRGDRRLSLGERAFEVVLARQVDEGTEETAWFSRHGSTPITSLPANWSDDYHALVQRRLDLIAEDPQIALLERPEHKRRWATRGWDALLRDALEKTILDRLEAPSLWSDDLGPSIRSVAQLAGALRHDAVLTELVTLLTGTAEHDLTAVLTSLVAGEAVPYLAAWRYKEAGIEKYRTWQGVWEQQRTEDANPGQHVDIEKPPTYSQADFRSTPAWRNRGKLDVPKERFTSYPGVGRAGDRTPLLGWAGWDHATRAQALARETAEQVGQGSGASVVTPLVAGLVELEPWLRQWHGEVDPLSGMVPADAITGFVDAQLATLGATRSDVDLWRPDPPARGRRPRS